MPRERIVTFSLRTAAILLLAISCALALGRYSPSIALVFSTGLAVGWLGFLALRGRRWARRIVQACSFLVIACLLLTGRPLYRAWSQKAAVAWVEQHGGRATYHHTLPSTIVWIREHSPDWILELEKGRLFAHQGYFDDVRTISLQGATQITDVRPLRHMRFLQEVYLDGTHVADLSPLRSLNFLEKVVVDNTPASDLSPLRGMIRLVMLSAEDTAVADTAPLAKLQQLSHLRLPGTAIRDIRFLSSLRTLKRLDIAETEILDLAPLRSLESLQVLNLSHTSATDYSVLRDLTRLTALNCEGTPINDLSCLSALTDLTDLGLRKTRVTDVTAIGSLHKLKRLDLSHTDIVDATALGQLHNLENLSLENVHLSDYSFLRNLRNLVALNLSGSRNVDLSLYHRPATIRHGQYVSYRATVMPSRTSRRRQLSGTPTASTKIDGGRKLRILHVIHGRLEPAIATQARAKRQQ